MRCSIVSWAMGLALVVLQAAAMAQIPSGSYQSSCKNVDVSGDTLTANCQDHDGKWEATQLRDYRSCGNDIMNDNGALRCGNGSGPVSTYQGGYQTGVPNGSYTQSCQDIRVHGDDLEARCQTSDGNWHKTKLDKYQDCRGDVANENGELHCMNGAYGAGYPGGYRGTVGNSYTQSCKDIKSHGDHLEARCKTASGDWVHTSLDDYRKCKGQIINDNGNLRCVAANTAYIGGAAGYASGNFPAGSYTQTCQEIHVNGDDLEARCSTANGDWRSSKLDDFQKCRGDIVNDDGHLRCAK